MTNTPTRCPHDFCGRLLIRQTDGTLFCDTSVRDRDTGDILGCGHTQESAK